jgi:hypothetical protein
MAGLASGIRRFMARMGGTVLIAVAAVSSSGMGRPAMAEDIKAFPLAIICEFSGISHVFYLSKLESEWGRHLSSAGWSDRQGIPDWNSFRSRRRR